MNDDTIVDLRRVLPTDRDRSGLVTVGEMYALRRDTLAWAFVPPGEEPLRLGRVGTIVRRWQTIGFAESQRLEHGHPDWVWLTRMGMTFAGLEHEPGPPQLINLAHTHAVALVRIRAEHARWCAGWISERTLLTEKPSAKSHTPDGVLVGSDGCRYAVEVERTQKAGIRLQRIVTELATRAAACDAATPPDFSTGWWWNRVLYVPTTPGAAGAVHRAVAALPSHLRHLVAVHDFKEFQR